MKMIFRLYTYDLWVNPDGGYSVNDVYRKGIVTIDVPPVTYNPGTPYEVTLYDPSDEQLNKAVRRKDLTWVGEASGTLWANDKHGNPACELRRLNPDGKEYWDVPKFTDAANG